MCGVWNRLCMCGRVRVVVRGQSLSLIFWDSLSPNLELTNLVTLLPCLASRPGGVGVGRGKGAQVSALPPPTHWCWSYWCTALCLTGVTGAQRCALGTWSPPLMPAWQVLQCPTLSAPPCSFSKDVLLIPVDHHDPTVVTFLFSGKNWIISSQVRVGVIAIGNTLTFSKTCVGLAAHHSPTRNLTGCAPECDMFVEITKSTLSLVWKWVRGISASPFLLSLFCPVDSCLLVCISLRKDFIFGNELFLKPREKENCHGGRAAVSGWQMTTSVLCLSIFLGHSPVYYPTCMYVCAYACLPSCLPVCLCVHMYMPRAHSWILLYCSDRTWMSCLEWSYYKPQVYATMPSFYNFMTNQPTCQKSVSSEMYNICYCAGDLEPCLHTAMRCSFFFFPELHFWVGTLEYLL
jgi:hypothetical protein